MLLEQRLLPDARLRQAGLVQPLHIVQAQPLRLQALLICRRFGLMALMTSQTLTVLKVWCRHSRSASTPSSSAAGACSLKCQMAGRITQVCVADTDPTLCASMATPSPVTLEMSCGHSKYVCKAPSGATGLSRIGEAQEVTMCWLSCRRSLSALRPSPSAAPVLHRGAWVMIICQRQWHQHAAASPRPSAPEPGQA